MVIYHICPSLAAQPSVIHNKAPSAVLSSCQHQDC